MKRLSKTTAFALPFAVAWLSASPLVAQEKEEPGAEKDRPDRAAPARQRGRPAGSGLIWWNDPQLVEGLSLSDEQRKKMDGYLETYRETTRMEDRVMPASFTEALGEGDWNKARGVIKKLSEQAGVPIRAQGELKIDVLSALSAEQRKTMAEQYPRLIRQPWVRGRRQQGARRPARPGAGN